MASGAGYYTGRSHGTVLTIFALGPLRVVAYRWIERFRPEEKRFIVELPAGAKRLAAPPRDRDPRQRASSTSSSSEVRDRRVVTLEVAPDLGGARAGITDLEYVIASAGTGSGGSARRTRGKLSELRARPPGLGDRAARRRRVSTRARRDVLRERAREGGLRPRGRRRRRRGCSARTPASRSAGSTAGPGIQLGALRRRRSGRRRCSPRWPASRTAARATSPSSSRSTRGRRGARHAARSRAHRRRAARQRGLRLRPDLRPRSAWPPPPPRPAQLWEARDQHRARAARSLATAGR